MAPNSASVWPSVSPSRSAREKLAISVRVAREQGAGLVPAVAAGQGDDPQHARVGRQLAVQARLGRDRDLEHDAGVGGERVDVLGDGVAQQRLGLLLVRARDADLGLDDRDQARGADPGGVVELLVHDRGDAGLVGVLDHRPHLGAEDLVPVRAAKQVIEGVDGLHELHVVLLGGKPQVHLEERDDVLGLPEVLGSGHALDGPVHGLHEQDRGEDPRAVERRVRYDPGPHGVDEVEHLVVGAVPVLLDAVLGERLRRAAAALVEGGEEAAAGLDLLKLCSVHPSALCHQAGRAGHLPGPLSRRP